MANKNILQEKAHILHERYSRQILFKPIGEDGQRRISAGKVTLVGCGALGTGIAERLVRTGVGSLKICDRDFVELNNLQRQSLFCEEDVHNNMPKAVAAADKLRKINSSVKVEPIVTDVNHTNIEEIIRGSNVVLDGTDNFEVRFLINDACVKNGIPWIYGACVGSYGMAMAIVPRKSACFACAIGGLPSAGSSPTCDTVGVLNSIVGVVSSVQVNEAIKILTGAEQSLMDGVAVFDLWANTFQRFRVARADDCKCCVRREFEYLEGKNSSLAVKLCGRNAVQLMQKGQGRINFSELAQRLKPLGRVTHNCFLLKFYIAEGDGEYELTLFTDGRAIVKGTEDRARARTLYAKYVGA